MSPIIRESAAAERVSVQDENTKMLVLAVSLPVRIRAVRSYNGEEGHGQRLLGRRFSKSSRERTRGLPGLFLIRWARREGVADFPFRRI